jgi:hypothetical protein
VFVTGAFGLAAAGEVVRQLVSDAGASAAEPNPAVLAATGDATTAT